MHCQMGIDVIGHDGCMLDINMDEARRTNELHGGKIPTDMGDCQNKWQWLARKRQNTARGWCIKVYIHVWLWHG